MHTPSEPHATGSGTATADLNRRLRAYYDRTPDYHAFHAADATPDPEDPYDRAIAAHIRPRERVLDLAGGSGWLRRRLPPGVHYRVSDMSLEALRQARAAGVATGVAADVRRLPFRDQSFDAVVCHHGLEHFAEPEAALKEALRVLVPGGRLVLLGPSFDAPRMPLPMLSHRPLALRAAVRARLTARLVLHCILHALGRFSYDPLIIADVASLHGVGPVGHDHDAVHPTQLHETHFLFESLGCRMLELGLWAHHNRRRGARLGLARLAARLPIVKWTFLTFPLVVERPPDRSESDGSLPA